jgi:hypothetical protein
MNEREVEIGRDKMRSQSFISTSSHNSDEYANREEFRIKDLMMKIQVLRNGVIEERNKNSELEKEMNKLRTHVKELDNMLIDKENMIVNLSKEKYELISKLDIEKQKNEGSSVSDNSVGSQFTNLISGIFQKRDSTSLTSENEVKKLQNELKDFQLENAILKKKVEDQSLDFEKCKIEYQNLINLQLDKIKKLDLVILEKNKSIDENNKKLEIMFDNYKKFDVEKTKYESQIAEYQKDNKVREEKIVELLLKLEDKEHIVAGLKESLQRHEIESSELARKLAELKNAIIETNMVIQNFKCEKVGALFNSDIEITFGRTDDDEYVMIVREDENQEYINVEDIEYLKTNEKFMDMIDFCYLVSNFILEI